LATHFHGLGHFLYRQWGKGVVFLGPVDGNFSDPIAEFKLNFFEGGQGSPGVDALVHGGWIEK
jgi:hypothetical protein